MAGPLRFRRSRKHWGADRVRRELFEPLDERFGATLADPWFDPDGYEARRLEMDNGDFALFCWTHTCRVAPRGEASDGGPDAYWLGNTETPEVLWRTTKFTFGEAPAKIGAWAERELFARLEVEEPWLARYEHVARFFLPVLFSKDGRETTREFFADHAAGFPDADRDAALAYYDDFLATGALDEHRYTMAAKLGTSQGGDWFRMAATMSEFTVAKLLADAGLEFDPEVELDSGHALDFRVDGQLVEVTRPRPPTRRRADTAVAAVRQTGRSKTDGQLRAHPDALLLVDCSSFPDDEWQRVAGERPDVAHRPTVVFRTRPDGSFEGYRVGRCPLDFGGVMTWRD
ncbi:MAG: DUF5784 family protein [Haloglomus sp.]